MFVDGIGPSSKQITCNGTSHVAVAKVVVAADRQGLDHGFDVGADLPQGRSLFSTQAVAPSA